MELMIGIDTERLPEILRALRFTIDSAEDGFATEGRECHETHMARLFVEDIEKQAPWARGE